jgi:hypothetical protein
VLANKFNQAGQDVRDEGDESSHQHSHQDNPAISVGGAGLAGLREYLGFVFGGQSSALGFVHVGSLARLVEGSNWHGAAFVSMAGYCWQIRRRSCRDRPMPHKWGDACFRQRYAVESGEELALAGRQLLSVCGGSVH